MRFCTVKYHFFTVLQVLTPFMLLQVLHSILLSLGIFFFFPKRGLAPMHGASGWARVAPASPTVAGPVEPLVLPF
jgi:hypothetical protein